MNFPKATTTWRPPAMPRNERCPFRLSSRGGAWEAVANQSEQVAQEASADRRLLSATRLDSGIRYDGAAPVRGRPSGSTEQPEKREPTREELEALIELAEQSGSETDRLFAESLRKALDEHEGR